MIYDNINSLRKYIGVIPHLEEVLSYLDNNDLYDLPFERIDISDNVYLVKQKYIGKDRKDAGVESHKKYIDIQLMLKGRESMYYGLYNYELKVSIDYDDSKDIMFYDELLNNKVEVSKDEFVVFFKEDIHQPGIKVRDEEINKVVIKIRY